MSKKKKKKSTNGKKGKNNNINPHKEVNQNNIQKQM